LATGLDLLLGGLVVGACSAVAVPAIEAVDVPDRLTDYVLGIVSAVVVLAYTSTDVWFAGTPGKLLLGLRIGAACGVPADRWTLALRWSSKYFGYYVGLVRTVTLDAGTLFLGGWANTVVMVGCLQALDEHRRAWHDEWAGTAVLRRPRRDPTVPPPLPVTTGGPVV
jgi:uncharacterized RDD family membrane protein YckC